MSAPSIRESIADSIATSKQSTQCQSHPSMTACSETDSIAPLVAAHMGSRSDSKNIPEPINNGTVTASTDRGTDGYRSRRPIDEMSYENSSCLEVESGTDLQSAIDRMVIGLGAITAVTCCGALIMSECT